MAGSGRISASKALEVFFYLLSIASNALSLAPLAGRPLGRLAGVLFGVGGALGEFGDEAGAVPGYGSGCERS